MDKIYSKIYGVLSKKFVMSQFCAFIVIFWLLWLFMALYGTFSHFYGTFWHFWPVTLYFGEFTFVAIYASLWVNWGLHKPCLCNFFLSFSMSECSRVKSNPDMSVCVLAPWEIWGEKIGSHCLSVREEGCHPSIKWTICICSYV